MKRALPLVLTLCASACWPRTPGPVAFDDAAAPVTVLRAEGGDSEVVTWTATVRAGSAHDPIGQEGLAWLLAEVLADQLATTGGDVDLRVGAELVDFALTCPVDQQRACADALADTLTAPRFDEDAITRAKAAAHRVADATSADPDALLAAAARAWLWSGHPYGHAAWGRTSVVDSLQVTDLQRMHAARYLRPAAVLGVIGPADDSSVVAVQGGVSALPPRLYRDVTPRGLPTPVGAALEVEATVALDRPLAAMVVAVDLPPGHRDRVALAAGLDLLADALDPIASARLGPDADMLQPAILLTLQEGAASDPAAVRQALDAWLAEGPTEPALDAWKQRHEQALADPVAEQRALAHAHLLGVGDSAQAAGDEHSLSADDVRVALNTWVHVDDLRLVRIIGSSTPQGHDGVEGSGDASVDGSSPDAPPPDPAPRPEAEAASTAATAAAAADTAPGPEAFALSAEDLFR